MGQIKNIKLHIVTDIKNCLNTQNMSFTTNTVLVLLVLVSFSLAKPPGKPPGDDEATVEAQTPKKEIKPVATKVEPTKPPEVKNEPKHEEPKQEATKHEEPKHEEPKHEEPKHEEPKYEEPKHEEPKHEEPKHEEP